MDYKLRDCPFCGGKVPTRCHKIDGSGALPDIYEVSCVWCGATVSSEYLQVAEAYWNRRTPEKVE